MGFVFFLALHIRLQFQRLWKKECCSCIFSQRVMGSVAFKAKILIFADISWKIEKGEEDLRGLQPSLSNKSTPSKNLWNFKRIVKAILWLLIARNFYASLPEFSICTHYYMPIITGGWSHASPFQFSSDGDSDSAAVDAPINHVQCPN